MERTREDIADELLVMRCQGGSVDAFEELVDRWERPLRLHACRLTGRQDAGREVVQEAWLGIIRGIEKLSDPAMFKAWAYRIVRNRAASWIKRRGRSRASEEALDPDLPAAEVPDDEGEAVRRALASLPAGLRTVLALHYLDDLPVREVAARLGLPTGTVKSRLHYGRRRLRESIERSSDD